MEPSYTTGKNVNWFQSLWKIVYTFLKKLKIELSYVMPDIQIPEREERRLPRQCNSQK